MKQLCMTFVGPRVSEEGVPVDGLVAALKGIQDAMRLMVGHLGNYREAKGQPPKWVRDQSRLSLTTTRQGSVVAELSLNRQSHRDGLGLRALDALLEWDGSTDSTLPKTVTSKLNDIPRSLPTGVQVWLGDQENPRRVEVKRTIPGEDVGPGDGAALLYGWLNAVNWDKGTAQLHRYGEGYVPLRFDDTLHDEMRRFATLFVEVRGTGRLNKKDEWASVQVEQIAGIPSMGEPFDLGAFQNNPNPKIFNSDKVIRASEPFDVDEFMRMVRESRDA